MKPIIVKREYSNGETKYVIRVPRSFLFIKWWVDIIEYDRLEQAKYHFPEYAKLYESKKLIKEEKVE